MRDGGGIREWVRADQLLALEPLSREAFQRLGEGTSWPADVLSAYADLSGVVVFIASEHKYLFHAPTGEFVDAHGVSVDPYTALGKCDQDLLWEFCQALAVALDPMGERSASCADKTLCVAVSKWGLPLGNVPIERRDAQTCLTAVRRDGCELADVPESIRTADLCLAAVTQDGTALAYVPIALRTTALCAAALEAGGALQDVPESVRSREICLLARTIDALCWVPWSLRDEDMCSVHLSRGALLRFVPYALRTRALCAGYLSAKDAGTSLGDRHLGEIPFAVRDRTICLEAVRRDGDALFNVPLKGRTLEICLAAAPDIRDAWDCVPPELRAQLASRAATVEATRRTAVNTFADLAFSDRELDRSLAAIDASPYSLAHVPEELRTGALALKALASVPCLFNLVPEDARDETLSALAVSRCATALAYVPDRHRTRQLCLVAVRLNGAQLADVPDDLRDRELCLAAVNSDAEAMAHVPFALRDMDMCLAAMQSAQRQRSLSSFDLRHVPDACRNAEVVALEADRTGGFRTTQGLRHVPLMLRDERSAHIFLFLRGHALVHVPPPLRSADLCAWALTNGADALTRLIPGHCRSAALLAARSRSERDEPPALLAEAPSRVIQPKADRKLAPGDCRGASGRNRNGC